MEYESIIFERDGGIAIITLNRPQAVNALTYRLIEEFLDALARIAEDETVRAVVITGAGRGFCSGDSLTGMEPVTMDLPPGRHPMQERQQRLIKTLRGLPKPVIAMINGHCYGAGSDIALASDFRIAGESARLGDIRTSRAITLSTGAPYLLPQIVGVAKAVELLFTGDTMDAREAERIGLVNKTVPDAELRAATMQLANRLAQGPTKAIGIAKTLIYGEQHMNLEQALDHQYAYRWMTVRDGEEGRKSFIEKRQPHFTGH